MSASRPVDQRLWLARALARPAPRRRMALGSLLALLAASGCSDDDREDRSHEDLLAPVVSVTYPLTRSSTDALEISVRGTASDDTGVSSVRVNGVEATSVDGFASWVAPVPLELGDNAITVEAEDPLGHIESPDTALSVQRLTGLLHSPHGAALDGPGQRLFVTDHDLNAVFTIDLLSGDSQLLSADDQGAGPSFSDIREVAYDAPNDRLLVIEGGRAVVAVDTTTGDRAILSDASTGAGVDFDEPHGLALDGSAGLLYVTDPAARAIYAIDLPTGDRTVLSDAVTGTGPALDRPKGIALDLPGGRALVIDMALRAVLSVDLATGDRLILSDADHGAGPVLSLPPGIVVDPTSDQAYVTDQDLGAVFQVDLITGDRTILADEHTGAGPVLARAYGIAFASTDQLLVADAASGAVVELQPSTGTRTALTQVSLGSGPPIVLPAAVSLHAGCLVVLDEARAAVMQIPMATSDRTVLSDATTGSGPVLQQPKDLDGSYCGTSDDYVVVDSFLDAVIIVDSQSGDRTVLSDGSTGAGAAFEAPVALAVDLYDDQVLVVDEARNALVSVDWLTGDRTTLSDDGTGSGPSLDRPIDLAHDQSNARAFVISGGTGEVLTVDLATGNRQVLSTCAAGPTELTFDGAALFAGDRYGVQRIDTSDGACSPVATPAVGTGPALLGVGGLIHDSVQATTFAMSLSLGAVIMIDGETGDRVIVSK